MSRNRNSRNRARRVHVLLLSWEDNTYDIVSHTAAQEINYLATILNGEYGFSVAPRRFKLENTDIAFEEDLFNFEHATKLLSQDLVIIHYSGHGGLSRNGEFIFTAGQGAHHFLEPPNPVYWRVIGAFIGRLNCSVLMTVDACNSGGIIHALHQPLTETPPGTSQPNFSTRSANKEVILSCGYQENSPGSIGGPTFSKFLINELKDRAASGPFTVASLHRGICARILENSMQRASPNVLFGSKSLNYMPMPIHVSLGEDPGLSSIVLRPIR